MSFYANSYMQLAIIAPLILAAPRYFSGEMALGGLMQTVSAFGRVQDGLSYFVEAYDTIAKLVSVIHRLYGFTEHLEEVGELRPAVEQLEGGSLGTAAGEADVSHALVMNDVDVKLPNGTQLLAPFSLV